MSIDSNRSVQLYEHTQYDLLSKSPEHTYNKITLTATRFAGAGTASQPSAYLRADIAHRTPGASGDVGFNLGRLEPRLNESRDKLWFVDTDAQRVVATLDFATLATTGPDDPAPEWAMVSGGFKLAPIPTGE